MDDSSSLDLCRVYPVICQNKPTINTYFDVVLYTELCNQSSLHTPHLIPSRGAMQGCRDGTTS